VHPHLGSNRTIVGLKLVLYRRKCSLHNSSNRTIVGLKPFWRRVVAKVVAAQQSHHCGIETVESMKNIIKNRCSNRTIVGLKRPALQLPLP